MPKATCKQPGCERLSRAQGLCTKHYQRWRKYGDTSHQRPTALERWRAKVSVGSDDECWEWRGNRNRHGYGYLTVTTAPGQHHSVLAHRLAWELLVGSIPPGLFVLHRCDNPPCCNPAHLRLGTQADNVADMIAKGRKPTGEDTPNGQKTHCIAGHPYDEANTYTHRGERRCRACARVNQRRYDAERKRS